MARKGRDLAGCYAAEPEAETVHYEVYELEPAGRMRLAVTLMRPGKVGNEYHMTKGHFHEDPEAGEIYFGLAGKGLLLMQTKEGETREVELTSGSAACIPPGWAHRSVNTGDEDFVFLAVFPEDAGHDYAAIETEGFKMRVVEVDGKAAVVPK